MGELTQLITCDDAIRVADSGDSKWKYSLGIISDIIYYAAYGTVGIHTVAMVSLYDYWADFTFSLIGYSIQYIILVAYCSAASSVKYEYFVKKNLICFWIFSFLNILGFLGFLIAGFYMYANC